jgi:AcrR family transcriptional regulator
VTAAASRRDVPTRKDELTATLVECLLERGVADLSLRPLAARAGTSARLLVYHYGSKDGLLGEVLLVIQRQLHDSFLRTVEHAPRAPLLRTLWNWALKRRNFAYLRLWYELQVLAARDGGPARHLERGTFERLGLFERALPRSKRRAALATLCCGVFDGLFIAVLAGGDRRRASAAIDAFVELAPQRAR